MPIILLSSLNSLGCLKLADNGDEQIINSDSIELTSLVRNVYEWHETRFRRNGFPFKFSSLSDSIFTGVDWETYLKELQVFRKTEFFSKDFFMNHRIVALSVDSSIKNSSIEWRNINDGIPVWDSGVDDWCGCQDYPDGYWNILTLNNFSYENDVITFYWTWGNKDEMQYEMKARKEDGTWRICYIQGFSYYRTVAEYDKTMKNHKAH